MIYFIVYDTWIDTRDVHGGAVAADFWKSHRGSGAVAVGSGKNHRGSGAVAFFSRTLKNCMNLVEFQCLQMKHTETKWIWWTSTNISGLIQSQQWNSKKFFINHRGSGTVAVDFWKNRSGSGAATCFYKPSRRGSGRLSTAMDISDRYTCFDVHSLYWREKER